MRSPVSPLAGNPFNLLTWETKMHASVMSLVLELFTVIGTDVLTVHEVDLIGNQG